MTVAAPPRPALLNLAVAVVCRLAFGARRGPAGHRRPLAPARFSAVVALEVPDEASRTTAACLASWNIEEVITGPRSPWPSPYVERLIGSIRRELLDRVIVWNE
jgi:hypothetical protein